MSDRDELILGILEKLDSKVDKLSEDIGEIKIQQALHDVVVKEHESRSTASEGRLNILEKDAQFFRNFVVIMTALGGLMLFVLQIWPLIHSR